MEEPVFPVTLSLSDSPRERQRGDGGRGEAAAAAGDGGLVAHIDLCHFSVSLSPLHLNPARSLHFTSHYTHMHAHAHTHHVRKGHTLTHISYCSRFKKSKSRPLYPFAVEDVFLLFILDFKLDRTLFIFVLVRVFSKRLQMIRTLTFPACRLINI